MMIFSKIIPGKIGGGRAGRMKSFISSSKIDIIGLFNGGGRGEGGIKISI
jgi:hypothetical protein